jgi:hypothetical protein
MGQLTEEIVMDPKSGRRRLPVALIVATGVALTYGLPAAFAQTNDPMPLHVSPSLPAEGDPIVIGGDLQRYYDDLISPFPAQIQGNQITLNLFIYHGAPVPPDLGPVTWNLPALPAGDYIVNAAQQIGTVSMPLDLPILRFTVRPRTALLHLVASRFQVAVADQEPGASPAAVQLSDIGGYFSFFDPGNVEITAKIVDGRALNSHYWVFVASMTDTPLTVTVTDTGAAGCGGGNACPSRTYVNPPHTNQNFIDVGAF